MIFKPDKIDLPTLPYLLAPIENEELLYTCQLSQFDREGYELLPIEQEYYKANDIILHEEKVFAHESGNANGWSAVIQKWFQQTDTSSVFKLDHSFCVVRYAFAGEALKQIQNASKRRPELSKLFNIIPKWGHDFCVDYVTPDRSYELIHWEWDFRTHDLFDIHRDTMEQIVTKTNWEEINNCVLTYKNNERDFTADVEGDFKANLFGLHKAFRLYKSF